VQHTEIDAASVKEKCGHKGDHRRNNEQPRAMKCGIAAESDGQAGDAHKGAPDYHLGKGLGVELIPRPVLTEHKTKVKQGVVIHHVNDHHAPYGVKQPYALTGGGAADLVAHGDDQPNTPEPP